MSLCRPFTSTQTYAYNTTQERENHQKHNRASLNRLTGASSTSLVMRGSVTVTSLTDQVITASVKSSGGGLTGHVPHRLPSVLVIIESGQYSKSNPAFVFLITWCEKIICSYFSDPWWPPQLCSRCRRVIVAKRTLISHVMGVGGGIRNSLWGQHLLFSPCNATSR